MLLLLLAFVAGALTVLAPCVLPLLPVIIGGSLSGDEQHKSRPYIITVSLALSLIVFTFLLKATTVLIHVPPQIWLYVSGGIVLLLGIVSVLPEAWEWVVARLDWQRSSQGLLSRGARTHGQWMGPILIGAGLGPVFSSCSPTYAYILATVLPRNFASGAIYLVTYTIGLATVLLLVSLLGRRFIGRVGWAVNPHSWFRRGLGIVFIVVGLSIMTGWDKRAETWLGDHSPLNIAALDQKLIATNNKKGITTPMANSDLFNVQPTPAPELAGLQDWINSPPLTLRALRGKVVLIDFWTYSCVNCVRTLPYVEKWYDTYKDKGFVVIGVHAPEFAFEHELKNVQDAVKARHITYPVALDNNYGTWNAFTNQYWPAHYLIDKDGNIRAVHYGEGGYAETERAIQALLGETGGQVTADPAPAQSASLTPETYFGLDRAQSYSGTPDLAAGGGSFAPSDQLLPHHWALGGKWDVADDKITSQSATSTLTFHVKAKDVYVVASKTTNVGGTIAVSASGQSGNWYGDDAPDGKVTVNESTIYHIASFGSFADATLTLTVPAGLALHTFTFGS